LIIKRNRVVNPANSLVDPSPSNRPSVLTGRLSVTLWLAFVCVLLATGIVLWSVRGERVFADMLSASIAWCM